MTDFQNPIVAKDKLVRKAIQSPNFLTGVEGWSINRDGTAEFQDITARGDLNVRSLIAEDSGDRISIVPSQWASGQPTIEYAPDDAAVSGDIFAAWSATQDQGRIGIHPPRNSNNRFVIVTVQSEGNNNAGVSFGDSGNLTETPNFFIGDSLQPWSAQMWGDWRQRGNVEVDDNVDIGGDVSTDGNADVGGILSNDDIRLPNSGVEFQVLNAESFLGLTGRVLRFREGGSTFLEANASGIATAALITDVPKRLDTDLMSANVTDDVNFTVVGSVSATLEAGRTYRVTVDANLSDGSGSGGTPQTRIQDSSNNVLRNSRANVASGSGNGYIHHMEVEFTAGGDGAETFTYELRLNAFPSNDLNVGAPSYLYLDYVRG